MTRYILLPKTSTNCFTLQSTIDDNSKDILISTDIISDMSIFDTVNNKHRLKKLLILLTEKCIFRTKNGFIGDNNSVINIKYDEVIIDTCNNIFKEEFEQFYCMLRNNDITF